MSYKLIKFGVNSILTMVFIYSHSMELIKLTYKDNTIDKNEFSKKHGLFDMIKSHMVFLIIKFIKLPFYKRFWMIKIMLISKHQYWIDKINRFGSNIGT